LRKRPLFSLRNAPALSGLLAADTAVSTSVNALAMLTKPNISAEVFDCISTANDPRGPPARLRALRPSADRARSSPPSRPPTFSLTSFRAPEFAGFRARRPAYRQKLVTEGGFPYEFRAVTTTRPSRQPGVRSRNDMATSAGRRRTTFFLHTSLPRASLMDYSRVITWPRRTPPRTHLLRATRRRRSRRQT
jgi:hypothetical protein